MNFIENMGQLITEIKHDISCIESYVNQLENDSVCWDTSTIEQIIEALEIKIHKLYKLTVPNY